MDYQTNIVNINVSMCMNGRCSHTFEPPSNPPSSYDSVSVAAVNVVGVGAVRNCTTQTISELLQKLFIVYKYYAPTVHYFQVLWVNKVWCTMFMIK